VCMCVCVKEFYRGGGGTVVYCTGKLACYSTVEKKLVWKRFRDDLFGFLVYIRTCLSFLFFSFSGMFLFLGRSILYSGACVRWMDSWVLYIVVGRVSAPVLLRYYLL